MIALPRGHIGVLTRRMVNETMAQAGEVEVKDTQSGSVVQVVFGHFINVIMNNK